MWTLSLVPTSSLIVALNRVFVFNTCNIQNRNSSLYVARFYIDPSVRPQQLLPMWIWLGFLPTENVDIFYFKACRVCHQSSSSPSSPNLGRLLLDHKRGLDQGVKEDVQPVRKLWQDVHTCLLKNANTKMNKKTDKSKMQLVITMHDINK